MNNPPSTPLSEPSARVAPTGDHFLAWSPDHQVYRLFPYRCPQCARRYVFGAEDLPAGEGAEDLEQTHLTMICGACGLVMGLFTSATGATGATGAPDGNGGA